MSLFLKILALVYGLLFLLVFIILIRKKAIKPFYLVIWLIISLFLLSFVIFEPFYKWIATKIGLTDASFLVIVGLISFLYLYALYISVKISEMSDRIQELISFTGILEHEIRKLKGNSISETSVDKK